MLLDSNTEKLIDLVGMFDSLNNIDKVRLTIYLLENKNFEINFNIKDIIILLKEVLNKLDPNYSKTIVNFAKYKHLLFLSAKYLKLTEIKKKKFSIEMLFNIYVTNFKDKSINKEINKHINDYCYSLMNK